MSIVRRIALTLAAGAASVLTLAVPGADLAAPDLDTLLQHLARPAPATTPFVEVHFSPLLSRPLIVSGELEYSGPDSLARTFSLGRAPELKTLLSSFSALLGGNRQQLERSFTLTVSGDDAHWTLGLTPRDSRVSQRVSRITVNGAAGSPRCMTTAAPDGSVTVMLMADAAGTPVPSGVDRAALDKLCH